LKSQIKNQKIEEYTIQEEPELNDHDESDLNRHDESSKTTDKTLLQEKSFSLRENSAPKLKPVIPSAKLARSHSEAISSLKKAKLPSHQSIFESSAPEKPQNSLLYKIPPKISLPAFQSSKYHSAFLRVHKKNQSFSQLLRSSITY